MRSARPNFVFILADDLGYADLGCTGARDAGNQPADVSPHLDRMAREGMRFTRAYANSLGRAAKRRDAKTTMAFMVPALMWGSITGTASADACTVLASRSGIVGAAPL